MDNGTMVGIRVQGTWCGGSIVRESTARINNKVVSDSKLRIDRANHKFWNGMDKSAETFFIMYIFKRLGRTVFPRGTILGGSP
jgi:hypothetical protein